MLGLAVFLLGALSGAARGGGPPRVRLERGARVGLVLLFLVTASGHFLPSMRPTLVKMVPPQLGNGAFWVTFTGVAEVAGAAGLLVPRLRRLAAGCLGLLLIAMFPANVYADLAGIEIGGNPPLAWLPRLGIQLLFLAGVVAVVVGPGADHDRRPGGTP